MPLYEFVCKTCGATFDDICQPDNLPPCPKCGASATERQISAPSPTRKNPFPCPPTGKVHSLGKAWNAACPGK